MIKFVYNDGGRADAGFKGSTGDCAARAIAIATGKTYREVYDGLNAFAKRERRKDKSDARTGVYAPTVRRYMDSIGWVFVPVMGIGTGCTMHVAELELPKGRLVLSLSRHYAASIERVLHDTHDCSREGSRCVYGYFKKGNV
jgi:hypothetical protein